jgi:hypothetical protein
MQQQQQAHLHHRRQAVCGAAGCCHDVILLRLVQVLRQQMYKGLKAVHVTMKVTVTQMLHYEEGIGCM